MRVNKRFLGWTIYVQTLCGGIKKRYSCKPTLFLHAVRLQHEDLGTPGFSPNPISSPSPPRAMAVFGLRGNAAHFIILMSRTQTAALQPRVLSDFNPSSFMESNGCAFTPTEGWPGGCGPGQANVTWHGGVYLNCRHLISETLQIFIHNQMRD